MIKLIILSFALLILSACISSVPDVSPPNANAVIDAQTVNGVTVTLAGAVAMPMVADDMQALDPGGHAHLFADYPAVAYLDISATNRRDTPADLYPATFGFVVIDGSQIDLAPYQFFADGDALDTTLLPGSSKAARIWFPLTSAQYAALQTNAPLQYVITNGVDAVYTFDATSTRYY